GRLRLQSSLPASTRHPTNGTRRSSRCDHPMHWTGSPTPLAERAVQPSCRWSLAVWRRGDRAAYLTDTRLEVSNVKVRLGLLEFVVSDHVLGDIFPLLPRICWFHVCQ